MTEPLKRDKIRIEVGLRLYCLVCVSCGRSHVDETEGFGQIVCSYCGKNELGFRAVRDITTEQILFARMGTLH